MKNGIYISLLSLGLIACGGDSDNDNLSIGGSFSDGIQGQQSQPALSSGVITEGASAELNTNYTGTVEEDGYTTFNFTLDEDAQVALVLSSGASDLDLSVTGTGVDLYSTLDNSNELIVFDAQSARTYSVTVEAYEGSGSFQFKLVEANRSSAGLGADEYLVSLSFDGTQTCSTDGGAGNTYDNDYSFNVVVNWNAGYIDDTAGTDRQNFASVEGNTFTINSNYSDSGDGWTESGQSTAILTTDFSDGTITGSTTGKDVYVENGQTETCLETNAVTGKVIL